MAVASFPSADGDRPEGSLVRDLLSALPLALLAIANGSVREATYQRWLGERTGHQVSTFTLIALVVAYAAWLDRRWKPTVREAWRIGFAWLGFALVFEFGVGRFIAHNSWRTLFADYNVLRGRLWPLDLAAFVAVPVALARRRK